MKIKNAFTIPIAPAAAWAVLNDVPRVARCAPGAQLLEARSDGSYLGNIAVRLGPVALNFKGVFAYKERDEGAYRVVAEASGNEAHNRGSARAHVVFVLMEDGPGTRVDVESDVQLVGAIAQYGRGAALIQSTAQALIDQFSRNLAAEIRASGAVPDSVKGGQMAAAEAAPAAAPIPLFGLLAKGILGALVAAFRRLFTRARP